MWKYDFFVLRSPIFPVTTFKEVLDREGSDIDSLLRELSKNDVFMEALFLASPSLCNRFRRAVHRGKDLEPFHVPLIKYFARSCFRPTPFGTFSGFSTGVVKAREGSLRLPPRKDYSVKAFLNFKTQNFMKKVISDAAEETGALKVISNDTCFSFGDRLHYCEISIKNSEIVGEFASVERSEALDNILQECRSPKTLNYLRKKLQKWGAGEREAQSYINDLLENGILVNALKPALTADSSVFHKELLKELKTHVGSNEYEAAFSKMLKALDEFDSKSPGEGIAACEQISRFKVPSEVLQADLLKPASDLSLPKRVAEDCLAAVELLNTLYFREGPEVLKEFSKNFEARYGEQAVPLLEALDPEVGAGYGHQPSADLKPKRWNPLIGYSVEFENFLLTKYCDALINQKNEVVFEKEDLRPFLREPGILPSSFSVLAGLSASSMEEVEKGNYLITFGAMSGVPATALLGRLCIADKTLCAKVENFHSAESEIYKDCILAEVVFHSETKTTNIARRPAFRKYEIPISSKSSVSHKFQIPLNDILVTCRGGEFILYSKKLKKRVIPRLTNAHNYTASSMPIYRFLCQLQNQGLNMGLSWQWEPMTNTVLLPRVRIGRVLLSLSTWQFFGDESASVTNEKDSFEKRRASFLQLMKKWKVPEQFVLIEGDQFLPVFVNNEISLKAFLSSLKGKSRFSLSEIDPAWLKSPVYGPEGSFSNEIVIPFIREKVKSHKVEKFDFRPDKRRKFPGSDWLYLKIYGGPRYLETLLIGKIFPIMSELKKSKAIEGFFFIRYGDPYPHLRLRMRGSPENLNKKVWPLVREKLTRSLNDGIWNLEMATYFPEMERYGGPALIQKAEGLFAVDSESVAAVLKTIRDTPYEGEDRWMIGVQNILSWFLFFDMSPGDALLFCARVRQSLGQNRTWNKELIYEASNLENRAFMKACVDEDHSRVQLLKRTHEHFKNRVSQFRNRADYLRKIRQQPSRDSIIQSHIHMSLNRLMLVHSNVTEKWLYDYVHRILFQLSKRKRVNIDR